MQYKETFVLIHGAWHGEWCFYKLKARLMARGHHVISFDLPALGRDRADPVRITLADHVDTVVSLLRTLEVPAVVVGHSYGGVVLSQACEAIPDKIKKAIYLTGFMLQNGQSLLDVAGADLKSVVTQNIVLNGLPPEDGLVQVAAEARKDAFYADCSEDDQHLALSLIVPQPFATFATPVQLGDNYNSVPKTYITCLEDKAITATAQKAMFSQFPSTKIHTLSTGHSPFLSEPDRLAEVLSSEAT